MMYLKSLKKEHIFINSKTVSILTSLLSNQTISSSNFEKIRKSTFVLSNIISGIIGDYDVDYTDDSGDDEYDVDCG